jgi:hypothetical protein
VLACGETVSEVSLKIDVWMDVCMDGWLTVDLCVRCRDKEGSFMVETTAWEGTAKKI